MRAPDPVGFAPAIVRVIPSADGGWDVVIGRVYYVAHWTAELEAEKHAQRIRDVQSLTLEDFL